MKKIVFSILLFFFSSSVALGCSCANFLYTNNEKYITSDFVGTVKVISTSENTDDKKGRSYIAKIKPIAIFKGKAPNQLRVAGTKDGPNWDASCEITVKPKEEWLVAISKNSLDYYPLSYCSFASRLKSSSGQNTSRSSHWQAIKHYQFLEEKVPDLHRDYMLNESSRKLSDYLDNFDGQSFDKKSAHYLITFDDNLNIKMVEILQGFNTEFDKKFLTFLKQQTSWEKENPHYNKAPVQDGTKHIVGIYYHEGEKKFLSQF